MDGMFARRSRRVGARGLGAMLFMLLALLSSQISAAPATQATPAAPAAISTISGTVTRDSSSGAGVSGGLVSATSGANVRFATTSLSGSYGLAGLPDGTYELSVRPAVISTTSPDWVYTTDPLLVAVPPSQTSQNLIVQSTTVTVSGKLALPTGATGDFSTTGQRAWVSALNQEGEGNTVQVDAAGNFTVKTIAGLILLNIALENNGWSVPASLSSLVYQGQAGDTIQVQPNPLQLVTKDGMISGKVTLPDGTTAAPQGIPVRAWRLDGADYEQTTSASDGTYSMKVISGTWVLRAAPQADELYPPTTGQYYVPAQSPQRVILASDTATATLNLKVAVADVTVSGSTAGVSPSTGVNGRVYSLYRDAATGQPAFGSTALLQDGQFSSLRLSSSVATTYTLGVYFPPDVPFTAIGTTKITVTNGLNLTGVTIPIAADNSHITGTLRVRDVGTYPNGLPGVVWGFSNSGGWARTRVNSSNGAYDLAVASTDTSGSGGSYWTVRAFVDPTQGYVIQRPRFQRVFLPYNSGNGTTIQNINFTLVQPSTFGTITGQVVAPDPISTNTLAADRPLPGVRVVAREFTGDGSSAFERAALTDINGRYTLRVPPGRYRLIVHLSAPRNLPPRPLITPPPAVVDVTQNAQTIQDLRFRPKNAFVIGKVTYDGSPRPDKGFPALVRARSSDGAVVMATANLSGTYVLGLRAGLRWSIQAVSSKENQFLRSNQLVISPTISLTPQPVGGTLVLTSTGDIPESQVFVFDANQDQLFTLANDSQVQIPAGSLATDGRVVLTVRPLPDLASDGGTDPVNFGYRLNAYDAITKLPIVRFLRPVTLVIPFTAAQLDALGITADRLVPSYWDQGSQSWKPVENVSVIVNDDGGGTVNITVDHFTDFALLGAPGGSLYLPILMR